MRSVCFAFVMLFALGMARADEPHSPRLDALTKKLASHERGAEEAFWRQVAADGTPIIEDAHEPGHLLVSFVWRGSATTKRVQLIGPVDPPQPEADLERIPGSNTFATTLSLPDTGRFIYSFMIDGDKNARFSPDRVRIDPFNKRAYDPISSTLELPHAPAQPSLVAHAGVATGTVWRHTLPAATTQEPARQILVYTPPGYSATGPAYPLLVAFDAEAATAALLLPMVLDELIAAKRIPPVVALLIGNVNRSKDLMPNPSFADFVALDLVRWVRTHYHATSDPRRTVLSGISLGGLASAYGAFRHPEVFGNVLSQSGSFWWGPKEEEPEATSRDYATAPRLPIRFWMEVGSFELGGPRAETTQLAGNRHLRDVLRARGYDVAYREFAGNHTYLCWRGTIADGLTALFGTPSKLPAARALKTAPRPPLSVGSGTRSSWWHLLRVGLLDGGDAVLTEAKRLLAGNSEGYAIDEDDVNMVGCILFLTGHAQESLPLLRWNTERFPKSANTWDSLAWVYRELGDRTRAIENFKVDVRLDPKNVVAAHVLADLTGPP
jgi:enterochelin esterase-like enzyme